MSGVCRRTRFEILTDVQPFWHVIPIWHNAYLSTDYIAWQIFYTMAPVSRLKTVQGKIKNSNLSFIKLSFQFQHNMFDDREEKDK